MTGEGVPRKLGKYEIIEQLGRGGFAVVYRALDTTLEREVALKVLHPQLLVDRVFVERFRREARALARLRHPHIITVYEVSEAGASLYIAMELANGPSLAKAIAERGGIPWQEALTVLEPVCEALDYAHEQGVVHRDLKPANVLLDRERGALLADFGIARLVGSSTVSVSLTGGIVGTPAYIAPEMWEDDVAKAPADVYALGCMVYEMLTGDMLFAGATPMQSMRAHDKGPQFPSQWPEGVPGGIDEALGKALTRDPADRYPSAGALWYALKDLEEEARAAEESQQRGAVIGQWRSETEQAVQAGEWSAAKMAAGRWLALAPGDAEAGEMLAHIERQQQLTQAPDGQAQQQDQVAALYNEARELARAGQWEQALARVGAIRDLDATFADPDGIAARAQEEVDRQEKVKALYAQARRFHQARRWQDVVDLFAQIQAIEADHADPDGLLPAAERALASLQRQEELSDLYGRALKEIDAGRWEQAGRLLAQVEELAPGFRETKQLLAQVEGEVERERSARPQQDRIAELYKQAQEMAGVLRWERALAKMEEIRALDPGFADPEGVAAKARESMTHQEEAQRRQVEAGAVYAEAVRLLQAGQYQKALQRWDQVRALDPHYLDRQEVQATARKKLAELAGGAPPKRGLPKWVFVAIGAAAIGVFILAAVVVTVMLMGSPTPTPEIIEVTRVVVVSTPTPGPRPTDTLTPTTEPPPTDTWTPTTEPPPTDTPTLTSTPQPTQPVATPTPLPNAPPVPTGARARLGKGSLDKLALSPDGEYLAVASAVGVYLYRADTLQPVWLGLAEDTMLSVAFSPDGTTLASGAGSRVMLGSVKTGERLRTLEGHTGYVQCVAFSPDGTTLASGAGDDTVILWNAKTGEQLHTLEGHSDNVYSVAFSPDGATLASGSYDETAILWDARTGERLHTLEGHTWSVSSVAFSPDGTTLASGSWDDTVILWNARTGERLRALEGHTFSVTSVAFSLDGTMLASGSWDDTVILWDAKTGKRLRTLEGHTDSVSSVAFSPDGATVASSSWDQTVIIWDAKTGEPLRTLEGYTGSVTSVAFSPDGMTLASGTFGDIVILWDIKAGEQLRTLRGHTSNVLSVAFSPDGTTLASGSLDGTVILWNAKTGERLRTLRHTDDVLSVAFSPDGATLASGSDDETVILWNAKTGERLRTLEGHAWTVNSVAFSPDGTTLASEAGDTVILWDAKTGERLRTLEGHTDAVSSVAFSADGATLASGSWDGTIILWDVR